MSRMLHLIVFFALVAITPGPTSGASRNNLRTSPPAEQLVIFVSPDASPLARFFHEKQLPKIRKLAGAMKIPLRIVDVREGAPPEVTITPLIVFQNHRGRAIFQGRFTGIDRIRNFLRTSRAVTPTGDPLVKTILPVWRTGRAVVAAPVKVAPVSGSLPKGYDHKRFLSDSRKAIKKGLSRFKYVKSVALRRADRMFYMDFNPWLSPDGTLFLSVALFSQFHCKKPVFTQTGEVISGKWKDRKRLFTRAAKVLEEAVADQLTTFDHGDGFDPVPKSVAIRSWAELGLTLPAAPVGTVVESGHGPTLGRRWIVEPAAKDAPPRVSFRFPAPLGQYAGEVQTVTGHFTLASDLSLSGATGSFSADPNSVTMGDPDLDHALHTAEYFLDTASYPASSFVIESVEAERRKLTYGELALGTMTGTFTMKGVSIPVRIRAMFEPIVHADGRPRLVLRGAFEVALPRFKIDGPDDPKDGSNAHQRLIFDFNLTLAPE